MSGIRKVLQARSLRGAVRVPGDKSASHRALMISALAEGSSTIEGLSTGSDVASTSAIIGLLGASRVDHGDVVTIVGRPDGLVQSSSPLDCGNSGTSMRLVSGIVSGIEGTHTLVGDESLSARPMDRVAAPLTLMGATVIGHGPKTTAPLTIHGMRPLRSLDYHVPTPSAQVKSAILLAGLNSAGTSTVREDVRTRSTTEDMLRRAGVIVDSFDHDDGRTVTISPGRPRAMDWQIPGDPSQAAFFAVLGAIHDDAELEVPGIDGAPERVGFVRVLARMGASVTLVPDAAGVSLQSRSSSLTSTEIYSREIPSVDEVPILAVAAAAARGVSSFRDMGELRVKESDRFAGSMTLAQSLGCRVWAEGDDFFIEGLGGAGAFTWFSIDAGLDHRMVMASAVAGAAGAGCEIVGAQTVTSSYPSFFDDLASLQ